MANDSLKTLRDVIATLSDLHKNIKKQRRDLVQIVAETEIEMVGARVGFAIKQLSDARDLLSKLYGSAIDASSEPVELTTDWRGHDK